VSYGNAAGIDILGETTDSRLKYLEFLDSAHRLADCEDLCLGLLIGYRFVANGRLPLFTRGFRFMEGRFASLAVRDHSCRRRGRAWSAGGA
jgi:hypothetical protein